MASAVQTARRQYLRMLSCASHVFTESGVCKHCRALEWEIALSKEAGFTEPPTRQKALSE